eukprot:Nk52_evm3s274 gene=Nk52_evmTU3s274
MYKIFVRGTVVVAEVIFSNVIAASNTKNLTVAITSSSASVSARFFLNNPTNELKSGLHGAVERFIQDILYISRL